MAKLCQWSKQINFAAVLTPREWDLNPDSDLPVCEPIYRKEYTGDGLCPTVKFKKWGKTVRTGPPDSYLPQIRTAHYDDLVSNSARSESSGVAFEDDLASELVDPDGQTNDEGSRAEGSVHGDSGSDNEAGPEWLSTDEKEAQSESGFEDRLDSLQAAQTTKKISEELHPANENLGQDMFDHKALDLLDGEATKGPGKAEISPEFKETDAKSHPLTKDRVARFGIPIRSRRDGYLNDTPTRNDNLSDSATSASTWSYFSHFTELKRIDLEKQAVRK